MDSVSQQIIEKINWLFEEIQRAHERMVNKEGSTSSNNGFIVVPIERKGVRALQLSEKGNELMKQGKVLYFDHIFHHIDIIRGKNVFVFDEAVVTGDTLDERTRKLKNINRNDKLGARIWSVALIIHRDSKFKPSIHPKSFVVSPNQFDILESRLLYLILSKAYPLDTDHPMITLKIPIDTFPTFLTELENFGNAFELPYSEYFKDTRFITIDTNFKISTYTPFPTLYNDGVNKIRLYIKFQEDAVIVRCVPIIFPTMEFNKDQVRNCKLRKKFGDIAFCNLMSGNGWDYDTENECFNCVTYHINISLISWFIQNLRESYKEFNIIDYGDFRAFYPKIGEILREHVEHDISTAQSRYINNKQSIKDLDFEKEAQDKNNYIKVLDKMSKKPLWPYLSNMIKICNALRFNYKQNTKFVNLHKNNDKNNKTPVTYSQIINLFKEELPPKEISMALDQILDYGLAKPVNIKFKYDSENNKSILFRAYQTAGEDIDHILSNFFISHSGEEYVIK